MVRFAHRHAHLTGIPRVSLTLAHQAHVLRPDQVRIGYFDVVACKYRELTEAGIIADREKLRAHLRSSTRYIKQLQYWKFQGNKGIRFEYHRLLRQSTLGLERARLNIGKKTSHDPELILNSGDKIIGLGSGWHASDLYSYLASKTTHPEIVTLVHDLIPLKLPHAMSGMHLESFKHWLLQILDAKATLLFYSSHTKNDAHDWCARGGHGSFFYRHFRLGDELISSRQCGIRPGVTGLKSNNFILCVGSIEGRKNGLNLLKAWQRLRGPVGVAELPQLVFAGSSNLNNTKHLFPNGHAWPEIVFVTRPNDTELAYLYRHCRFTVYPSLYEGWGLPIGESLWHGKLCATSNCSAMPEVGGPDCDYFDPHDPSDIERTLRKLIFDDQYLAVKMKNIDRRRLNSWRDSAQDLLSALDHPARAAVPERVQ